MIELRKKHFPGRKGQIEITFNWFYVLIAGAIILLFFVGIIFRQKAVSEQQLATDVVDIMDSIFTVAGVSEKTKTFIDTSGLSDYTFYFSCSEKVSEFGIEGQGIRRQNNIFPVFSPGKIKSSSLILWSMPYRLPFKVIDLLFITSPNIKYYIIGNDPVFVKEFLNNTHDEKERLSLNTENIFVLEEAKAGGNDQVKIIDLDGTNLGSSVPESLLSLDDEKVTAVSFVGQDVDYYQKKGKGWNKISKKKLPLISLGGVNDAAKYAAIFAQDDQQYWCNIQKALKRVEFVSGIYEKKALDIEKMYAETNDLCRLSSLGASNGFDKIGIQALSCGDIQSNCLELIKTANEIKKNNQDLRECVTIY